MRQDIRQIISCIIDQLGSKDSNLKCMINAKKPLRFLIRERVMPCAEVFKLETTSGQRLFLKKCKSSERANREFTALKALQNSSLTSIVFQKIICYIEEFNAIVTMEVPGKRLDDVLTLLSIQNRLSMEKAKGRRVLYQVGFSLRLMHEFFRLKRQDLDLKYMDRMIQDFEKIIRIWPNLKLNFLDVQAIQNKVKTQLSCMPSIDQCPLLMTTKVHGTFSLKNIMLSTKMGFIDFEESHTDVAIEDILHFNVRLITNGLYCKDWINSFLTGYCGRKFEIYLPLINSLEIIECLKLLAIPASSEHGIFKRIIISIERSRILRKLSELAVN